MNSKKDSPINEIVDFVEDEEYYQIRRYKQEIENGTLGIYIFAVASLLFYVIFLLINTSTFDWVSFAINLLLISIYFCLAVYSNDKPFTAFVTLFCVVGIVFLLEIFLTSQINFRGILMKIGLIVYLSMRLEAAKKVQQYESKQVK